MLPDSHKPGDKYTGLDRFARVRDQRWLKPTDINNPLDRFVYGYDRNSNRLYRDNKINDNFDELYHVNGPTAGIDQRGPGLWTVARRAIGLGDIPATMAAK